MSDWPVSGNPPPIMLSPYSLEALGLQLAASSAAAPSSVAFGTANLARFYPFVVPELILVRKLWWYNGATANGNVEVGIFAEDGTRLVSTGSVAQGTVSVLQEVDITDYLLGRGRYYMGLTSSSTTGTFFTVRFTAVAAVDLQLAKAMGCAEMGSYGPGWAANATLAAATIATIPISGLSGRVLVV